MDNLMVLAGWLLRNRYADFKEYALIINGRGFYEIEDKE
jgi:hypothetical protein